MGNSGLVRHQASHIPRGNFENCDAFPGVGLSWRNTAYSSVTARLHVGRQAAGSIALFSGATHAPTGTAAAGRVSAPAGEPAGSSGLTFLMVQACSTRTRPGMSRRRPTVELAWNLGNLHPRSVEPATKSCDTATMAELNGAPVPMDELRSLALTNYGHFTSMRVDEGRVRGLTLHMNRLVRDCRTVFDADLDPEYVLYLVRKATADMTGSYGVRVTIYDPALEMGHPGSKAEPKVLVTSRPTAELPLPPLRVQTARFVRDLPQVKHIGLMASLHHRRAAQINGYDDAVFVDGEGFISEGVTWNIGFFDGDQVVWPQAEVLPGVTMALLSEVHEPIITARVNLAEVHGMVAAFATNTTIGVRPISAIDGHFFADEHPVLTELQEKYLAIPGEAL